MDRSTYLSTYNYEFFRRADGYQNWQKGSMRVGDAIGAVAYALGWSDWAQIKQAFASYNLDELGKNVINCLAPEQVEILHKGIKRWPKRVLDVGGGR